MTMEYKKCNKLVGVFTRELMTIEVKRDSNQTIESTISKAIDAFAKTTGEVKFSKCLELLFKIEFKTHARFNFNTVMAPDVYTEDILSFALMLTKGHGDLFFLYHIYVDLYDLIGTNGFNDTKNRLLDKAMRKVGSKNITLVDALYEFDHNDESTTNKLIELFAYIKKMVTTHCPHNQFAHMLFNLQLDKISPQRNRHENERLANALRLL